MTTTWIHCPACGNNYQRDYVVKLPPEVPLRTCCPNCLQVSKLIAHLGKSLVTWNDQVCTLDGRKINLDPQKN